MHPASHAPNHAADNAVDNAVDSAEAHAAQQAAASTAAGDPAPNTQVAPAGGKLLPTGGKNLHPGGRSLPSARYWARGLFWGALTLALAFALRMLEWPCWQNPEYRLGNEWLLATHDAYTWVACAEDFGLAVGHPMAVMLKAMADMAGATPAAVAF